MVIFFCAVIAESISAYVDLFSSVSSQIPWQTPVITPALVERVAIFLAAVSELLVVLTPKNIKFVGVSVTVCSVAGTAKAIDDASVIDSNNAIDDGALDTNDITDLSCV